MPSKVGIRQSHEKGTGFRWSTGFPPSQIINGMFPIGFKAALPGGFLEIHR